MACGTCRFEWEGEVTDRTAVNPANKVLLAWTVARIVRSGKLSLVS